MKALIKIQYVDSVAKSKAASVIVGKRLRNVDKRDMYDHAVKFAIFSKDETFGGCAKFFCPSLDEEILQEDAASLAMQSHEVLIKDGSFFSDGSLLALYFRDTIHPRAIFQKLFCI